MDKRNPSTPSHTPWPTAIQKCLPPLVKTTAENGQSVLPSPVSLKLPLTKSSTSPRMGQQLRLELMAHLFGSGFDSDEFVDERDCRVSEVRKIDGMSLTAQWTKTKNPEGNPPPRR